MTRATVSAHIRPAGPDDADAIACVQQTSWQESYHDKLPASVIHRAGAVWGPGHWRRILSEQDPQEIALVLDAEDFGVLGFGAFGPQRGNVPGFAGEIYSLYLMPQIQRQGVGTRLMQAMARVMVARGLSSALVWSLSSNMAARRFYCALGAVPIGPRVTKLFGEDVAEASYGWHDLSALAHDHDDLF